MVAIGKCYWDRRTWFHMTHATTQEKTHSEMLLVVDIL